MSDSVCEGNSWIDGKFWQRFYQMFTNVFTFFNVFLIFIWTFITSMVLTLSIKTVEAVRISKFVWQRVPDCRASIIKSPAAVRAKSAARHSETVQVSRTQTTTVRTSIRGWDEVICEVPGCPSVQTPVHCHTRLVLNPLRDVQPVELVV